MKSKIYGCALVGAMMMGSVPAFADINMCVFPRRPVAATHSAFKPMADDLAKALGENVVLKVDKDFKEFWKQVETKGCDLVHFNQYHYLKSNKAFGYKVITANIEDGSKTIAGSLSVRTDSGIKTVADLKGKTILFGGGKKAMGSYIAPVAILKKAGLEAEKDYKVQFAKNPPSAVIGTFNKAADAAGAGNVILKVGAVTKKIDASQMVVLAESEPFVQLPWAVKGDMPDDKAKKIQEHMLSLSGSDAGKAILKSAKVSGFQPVSDADFSKVKEIVKFALGEDY